jgi:hypothetical protein
VTPNYLCAPQVSEAGTEELFQAMELELQSRDVPRSPGPVTAGGRFFTWVLSFAVPGLGMFTEAYFVFSVGNLTGIFQVPPPPPTPSTRAPDNNTAPCCSPRICLLMGALALRPLRARSQGLCVHALKGSVSLGNERHCSTGP